ncbi:hypothetical protein [Nitrosomonas communis]|uniref:hypothetical protein n=1 Tax=Nitrosomonas communis TaxID=44574 RepID=UPI000942CC99|nr:hypothetical protein [Nitrosomonas communis]
MELLRGLPARFKRYLGAIALFGVGDFSHALLVLAATTLLTPSMGVVQAAQVAGLLYDWWRRKLFQYGVWRIQSMCITNDSIQPNQPADLS